MKKQKRDPAQRAFIKGYQAAENQRPLTACPFQEGSTQGFEWTRGWREGRRDRWSGYNHLAMQQKVSNF